MKVYRGLEELPVRGGKRSSVTIGNFDGVHRGHVAIIRRVKELALRLDALPCVMTFFPHPQRVLHGTSPDALVTLERKLELLEDQGVGQVVVVPFSKKTSLIEPEDFIEQFLVKGLRASAVVVGANFRFGHFARGDTTMLRTFGRRMGFEFEGVRLSRLDGRSVSSTEIRHAIMEGQLGWANRALGRPHLLPGRVIKGKGRGKPLGFPTANLKPADHVCIPKLGIYAGYFVVDSSRLPAAISVGTNPTFGGGPLSVEAFILEGDWDLYGSSAGIEFVDYLRGERRFSSVVELSKAIERDVRQTRRVLGLKSLESP